MQAEWIKIDKGTYKCSSCGGVIMTSYPIAQWTRCPFCRADMVYIEEKEEAADGDSDTENNS